MGLLDIFRRKKKKSRGITLNAVKNAPIGLPEQLTARVIRAALRKKESKRIETEVRDAISASDEGDSEGQ